MLLVLLLLNCAALVWLWVNVWRTPGPEAPQCGHCGYLVAGLEKLACPECGRDLREVGITTPRARRMNLWVFLLGWTLLLPIPAVLLSGLATRMLPRVQRANYTLDIAPLSGSFPQTILYFEYQASSAPIPVTASKVQVRSDGVTKTTTFGLPDPGDARLVDAQVRLRAPGARIASIPPGTPAPGPRFDLPTSSSTSVDAAALERFLAGQGSGGAPAAGSATRAADVADVAALASRIVTGRSSYSTTRLRSLGSTTSSGPARLPTWVPVLLTVVWLAIYVGGIVLVLGRRRAADGAAGQAHAPDAAISANPS